MYTRDDNLLDNFISFQLSSGVAYKINTFNLFQFIWRAGGQFQAMCPKGRHLKHLTFQAVDNCLPRPLGYGQSWAGLGYPGPFPSVGGKDAEGLYIFATVLATSFSMSLPRI